MDVIGDKGFMLKSCLATTDWSDEGATKATQTLNEQRRPNNDATFNILKAICAKDSLLSRA
jgi:hypothetical protein